MNDILAFNENNIESWIAQGYSDTKHCIGRILQAVGSKVKLTASEDILEKSIKLQENSELEMRLAMQQLKNSQIKQLE